MKCSRSFFAIFAIPFAAFSLFAVSQSLSAAVEGFESHSAGSVKKLKTTLGQFVADAGNLAIRRGKSHDGNQHLHLVGGEKHRTVLTLTKPLTKGGEMTFWAERWTRSAPFHFAIEAKRKGGWKHIYDGSKKIAVGGFHTQVRVALEKNTAAVRFTYTAPKGKGLLIDSLAISPAAPMKISSAKTIQPVIPTMVRLTDNPVVALVVETEGALEARSVTGIRVSTSGTTQLSDVKAVRIFYSGASQGMNSNNPFGKQQSAAEIVTFKGKQALSNGKNYFWVSFEMKDGANIDGRVDAGVTEIAFDNGKVIKLQTPSPEGAQRIGVAVARAGDANSKTFRIPGMATTNKGSLISVYDLRYNHGHDLPGDIDVGVSRSTDGGKTWSVTKVIMDMGNDKKWHYDGIGDPAVLVDRSNNRIWVAATWSHGNRSWRGSGKGLKPEETGQFMLVHSDDDGVTWSKPINITKQVKKPEWHFILQGPGKGITMKDGTLVFPAQYQDETSKRMPFSTLIYSKDNGKTWHCGTGVKSNTTEAQLVELADGSIMINCRDNRGGSRTIATTKDLGKTWTLHPTDRKALNEPVCMASLIRTEHHKHGKLLFFSNPNTPRPGKRRGRYDMSIKVSNDEGNTWPEKWHTLYDSRPSAGYSCMSMVGKDHVGVLYEGNPGRQMYFLRIPIKELLGE